MSAGKGIALVAVIVLGILFGPGLYHSCGESYYRWRLQATTGSTIKGCGGPYDESMGPGIKAQIEKCVAESAELQKAKSDLAEFTGTNAH